MHYMIAIHVPETNDANRHLVEASGNSPAWAAYTTALIDAGVMRGGNELAAPGTATIIRIRDGVRQVQDGPYAATKENLGGYYLIETDDPQAARDWAARCPAAEYGTVELRPVAGA